MFPIWRRNLNECKICTAVRHNSHGKCTTKPFLDSLQEPSSVIPCDSSSFTTFQHSSFSAISRASSPPSSRNLCTSFSTNNSMTLVGEHITAISNSLDLVGWSEAPASSSNSTVRGSHGHALLGKSVYFHTLVLHQQLRPFPAKFGQCRYDLLTPYPNATVQPLSNDFSWLICAPVFKRKGIVLVLPCHTVPFNAQFQSS